MLLVREPLQVITSSYKMFVEWKWVRSDNLSAEVVTQLAALRKCNRTLYEEPERLEALPGDEVLAYWQVLAGRVARLRHQRDAVRLPPRVARRRLQTRAVPPRAVGAPPLDPRARARLEDRTIHRAALQRGGAPRQARGARRALRGAETQNREASRRRGAEAPRKARLVNTHSGFSGDNAQNRTRLGGASFADFQRLAAAHTRLMQQLHLPELDSE